jgi:hypothetical protein
MLAASGWCAMGICPEREIVTGIRPSRCVRDRAGGGSGASAILPPYARRSKSLEVLLTILYLKSTGEFDEA